MSQSAQLPGVIPLSQAIHKYFELSLYLLVLMGFGTLASTGALDLPTIVLVGIALAFRGYLFAERKDFAIAERWTTPLTFAYFLFYATDYLLISRGFLAATVHLVLFAVVIRTFSLRRDRDYTTLAILAFLMILASAVLTVDSVFLFFFAAFMLTAVATFILMEMRRSGNIAQFQARHSSDPHEHRRLAFSLARITPALVLMILVGAAAVFFLLPRMSAGYLGGYSFGTDLSTGFSDHVQLGRIGQIQQSNAVVMHVQVAGDERGQNALHWRGVALARFDGRDWSNPPQHYMLPQQPDGSFPVPNFGQPLKRLPRVQSETFTRHLIHYRVLLEPIGTNVFFLAPWALRIEGSYRALSIDTGGAVYDADTQRAISTYEADSDITLPSPAQLRAAGDVLPDYAAPYLQLPALDPRIPRLAEQISGSASNNFDKAVAMESYLKTHYVYSLQLLRTPVEDPLANFLFVRKQGHCEYFASSMAVMLRTLHIPSRVVNGFRSDEFNDVTGNYVVRARNAHSWVEAYFPGFGWVTFDPTPGGEVGTPQGWDRAMLYLDAAQSFWRDWVVSYDTSHQNILAQETLSGTRSSLDKMRSWLAHQYAAMLNWARHSQRGAEQSPKWWMGIGLAGGVFLVLLGNLQRIRQAIRMWRLRAHPEEQPVQAAAMWYQRMAQYLARRRGVKKNDAQTAREFLQVIEDEKLRTMVGRFTEAYESARFGNSSDDARRLPELYEEVELAAKK